MRIISSQHDYYDCVMGQGMDRTNIYLRKEREVDLGREWPFPKGFAQIDDGFVDYYIIGFCGKIYPMLDINRRGCSDIVKPTKCFSLEDLDEFVNTHGSKKYIGHYNGTSPRRRWKWRWQSPSIRVDFAKFFRECKDKKESFFSMFEDERCPIFVAHFGRRWDSSTLTYNAQLRPMEFYRVFDTHATFQEIAMFMANLAIPQKPMPIISDEMKAQAHGFDKYSFRRPPGGK